MYFIVSKQAVNEQGQRGLIDSMESRADARTKAKELNGTVKTQAEYDEMLAAGQVHTGEIVADDKVVAPQSNDLTAAVEAGIQSGEQPVLHNRRASDRPEVKEAAKQLANDALALAQQSTKVATEAAALLAGADAGDIKQTGSILAAAQTIADAPRTRKTVGVKVRELKRPPTDEGLLLLATEYLKGMLKVVEGKTPPTKVEIVRGLALWENKKLQRKDVFAIIKGFPTDLAIAPATISTQFQFARSGKERQNG